MKQNKKLKEELEEQINNCNTKVWYHAAIIIIGILLCFTIIFSAVGIGMIIAGVIFSYLADSKRKRLKLELLKN